MDLVSWIMECLNLARPQARCGGRYAVVACVVAASSPISVGGEEESNGRRTEGLIE